MRVSECTQASTGCVLELECACVCVCAALMNGSVVDVEIGGQGSEPWRGAALELPKAYR